MTVYWSNLMIVFDMEIINIEYKEWHQKYIDKWSSCTVIYGNRLSNVKGKKQEEDHANMHIKRGTIMIWLQHNVPPFHREDKDKRN